MQSLPAPSAMPRVGWGRRDSSLGCQRQRGSAEISNLQAQKCQTRLPSPWRREANRARACPTKALPSFHSHRGNTDCNGKSGGLCHFPGCQCGRVTTLNNQIRRQHMWSQSPSTMMPIKSLAQKYHPGKEREGQSSVGLTLNLI